MSSDQIFFIVSDVGAYLFSHISLYSLFNLSNIISSSTDLPAFSVGWDDATWSMELEAILGKVHSVNAMYIRRAWHS